MKRYYLWTLVILMFIGCSGNQNSTVNKTDYYFEQTTDTEIETPKGSIKDFIVIEKSNSDIGKFLKD